MNKKIIYILLFALPLISNGQSVLLHYMDDLPQSRETNFSNMPNYRFTLGLPVIANTQLDVYTSSSLLDLFDFRGSKKLLLSPADVIGNMKKINYVGSGIRSDLLTASFSAFNTYFTINTTTRFESEIRIPRSLFELGWYGNGRYIGETADLSGLGVDFKLYNEIGLTATHEFFNTFTLGASIKRLQGLANIHTPANTIQLSVDSTTFALQALVDAKISMSGPIDTNGFNKDAISDMFSFKNGGFAFGFGGSYKLNDKLTFDANISDLGYIKWKNNTKTYGINDANFRFEGVKIDTSVFAFDPDSILGSITDSFFSTFEVGKESSTYVSALRAKLFLSATYNLGDKNRFGFIVYNRFGRYSNYTQFSLAYHRKVGNWLSAGVNYSMDNLGDSRLGAGLNLKIIGTQYYIMTDDLISAFRLAKAHNVSLRFGANIMLKMKDDDRPKN